MPPAMVGYPRSGSPPINSTQIGGRNKCFLPGDNKLLDTVGIGEGLPIWKRMAVIVRANLGLEVFEVMKGFDNYDRGFMERTQFYRALENLLGKPWIELAMTTQVRTRGGGRRARAACAVACRCGGVGVAVRWRGRGDAAVLLGGRLAHRISVLCACSLAGV